MQIEQKPQAISPRLKINLWKKIGKSQSFNQHDRLLQSPQHKKMSSSNFHNANDYLTINRMSKLSSNSSVSDHVISDQQSQSKHANSSNLKSSTSIFDEMKAQGIEIKNIDDSQSMVDVEEVIEESEFQSEFYKYQSQFKIKCLLQPKSSLQSGSVGYSQSEQFSPLPPFIDPSLINWSSRNFSKIAIKLKETTDHLSATRSELKDMHNLFNKFTHEFIRFIKNKDEQFKHMLRSYRISKSDSLIQTYLKAKQHSMIMEEDESHLSFSVKKSQIHEQAEQSCFIGDQKDLTPIKQEQKNVDFQSQCQLQSPRFRSSSQQNLSEKQWNQMDSDQKINALKLLLDQKDTQIQTLRHQMETDKSQYLQYKQLFGQTNNELNAQIDTMVEKLKTQQQKYLSLEEQFIKLKEIVQLKSSFSKDNVKSPFMKSSKNILKESHIIEDDYNPEISKLKTKIKDLEALNSHINNELAYLKQENKGLSQTLDEKDIIISSTKLQLASKAQQIVEKTQQLNALRFELEDQLGELPAFNYNQLITENNEKLKRSYSFGQLRRSSTLGSVTQQENDTKQTLPKIQNHQNLNESSFKVNSNRDELLRLKQEKLKEYQKQIQKLILRQNQLNQNLFQLTKQVEKLKKNQQINQQLQLQLEQTNKSIAEISKIRLELQESNEKLYQHIFDLEQRVAKAESQYVDYANATDQAIRQERIKYEQADTMYKELLQKINSINNLNTIPITQIPSSSSLNHQSNPQNLINEIKLYKKLYEQKKSQLQQVKQSNAERKNLIINEDMEKQTDKFRIQALRQDVLVQQQIIRRLQQQKDELLHEVKELSKKLADKEYSLEKLNIELRKEKFSNQHHKNQSETKRHPNIGSRSSFKLQKQQTQHQRKNQKQRSLEISMRQEFLRKKEEELHKAELKIESYQRKLELTKKQVQTEYQTLLMKYQDVRTAKDQNMNRKSLQHLLNRSGSSRNHKRSYDKDTSIHPFVESHNPINQQVLGRSRYVLTSRCQSPQQNTLQAQKIINELKSRQFYPTSDRASDREVCLNRDISGRVNFSPNVKKILSSHNISNATQLINRIRSNSPITYRLQSPKRIELTKVLPNKNVRRENQYNRPSQEKKLKLKFIEQKMKKLKEQVRDSIRQPK